MNANDKPYDPSVVRDVLCRHFNMPANKARLTVLEKDFLGLGGPELHYYHFALTDGRQKRSAFGKTVPVHDREYRALQYLATAIPEQSRSTTRPIASLKYGSYSLLLLEYLEGYSNLLSIPSSLRLFPNRALNVARLGEDIVDKIYDLQKEGPLSYGPLSQLDTDKTPGQPVPTSIFKQLKRIKSVSIDTKRALHERISEIVNNRTPVRRGVTHGQLGMRNIMVSGPKILFIDWEYMQATGFCLFDPCYMATMLLMRAVQLFIPQPKLDAINDHLFQHIKDREESLTADANRPFLDDGLWFAKCVAVVDTLYESETAECSRLKALLRQERRKIRYLAYDLERHVRSCASR
jgi:hypothetical protein